MRPINGNAHYEDGELVRLMGDELTADARVRIERHMDACAACAARLEALRAELADASALLAEMPVPALDAARRQQSLDAVRSAARQAAARRQAPARAPFRLRLAYSGSLARAAAVAALLVAGGVAASPAGEWIVDRVRDLFQPAEPTVVAEPVPSSIPAHSSAVAFAPMGDELVIEFRTAQEHGQLVLRIVEGGIATARVQDGIGELDIRVLPGALRIENHYEVDAHYEISVPVGLDRLRLRVGNAQEMVIRPAELGLEWSAVIGLRHGVVDAEPEEL
jgi:hypothetical protein